MEVFRFLKFPVYLESKLLYQHCYLLAHTFTRENLSLADQLRRAALSICLNIAEGSGKYSDKEFKRYLENALGSVSEVVACLDIARENKQISEKIFEELRSHAESITKQLGGLSKKLRSTI